MFDSTIMRLNAHENKLMGKSAVQELVRNLGAECGIAGGDVEVRGNDRSRMVIIAFSGNNGDHATATRRVDKFFQGLRDANNQCRELFITNPSTTEPIRVYINKEKSSLDTARSSNTALLRRCLIEVHPELLEKIRSIPGEAAIECNWQVLSTLEKGERNKRYQ